MKYSNQLTGHTFRHVTELCVQVFYQKGIKARWQYLKVLSYLINRSSVILEKYQ